MPGGHPQRNPPPESHLSPTATSKATHIRNKDGTKLITVPSRKVSNPDSTGAPPSPPPAITTPSAAMDYSNGGTANNSSGKKKKKKKGGKQAAPQVQQPSHTAPSAASEDHGYGRSNGPPLVPGNHVHHYQQDIRNSMAGFGNGQAPPPDLVDPEDEDDYYSEQEGVFEDDEPSSPQARTIPTAPATGKKKNKKKKKKGGNNDPSGGGGTGQNQGRKGKDRIWNTSTAEERERIKDFWLSLGEDERRSLVKVEKEAVLRKMKEQQKHSCSCSVCGRKRTAIEEELEVLYDAYYEELEQYANQQQTNKYLGHIPPSPSIGTYSTGGAPPPPPLPGPPPAHHHHHHGHHHGHHGHQHHPPLEEIDDDEFDEEEDDEYEDEDDILDHPLSPQQNDPRPDFFNFGNSLTVQGGILTVADDLLKNDGKKFIEMMEQLAERRMAREEEANAAANGHTPMSLSMQQAHAAHSHAQHPEYDDEEEYDDEDEEDDYDDEEEEDDEPDTMTEEQRMEEGRRMFQIFAARMFEQRVLTAYREKVARERQRKLLEELDEETRRNQEREEKKAKDKDKKKEKKRLQRQAKEEERLRKEAEKAAEEAKLREVEQLKAEEQRKRKEEQRLKREAERKTAEEERQRKEEERKKRQQEEREREAERERKRKEHQERERKRKEETARKMKEEKEAREKEARERKEREDKERREQDAKARKEAVERERQRKEDEAKAKAEAAISAAAKRTLLPNSQPSTVLQRPAQSGFSSPHLGVVTPAVPKAVNQVPGLRNPAQQETVQSSQQSSPKTPSVGPRMGSAGSPSTPILQQSTLGNINMPNKAFGFSPAPGMGPPSPLPHQIPPPPGVPPPDVFGNMSPLGMNGVPFGQPFLPGMAQRPSLGNGIPIFAGQGGPFGPPTPQYRGFATPNGLPMQMPPGQGMRPLGAPGRGSFMDMSNQFPPGVPLPPPGSPFINRGADPVPISQHSRGPSGSYDPVPRPTPIQRPASVAPPKQNGEQQSSVDELSKVMGSRALLDDSVDPLPENMSPSRRSSNTQFAPRPMRGVPASSPLFGDALGDFGGPSWSNPMPLGGTLSGSLPSAWANGAGWSVSNTDVARSTHNLRRVGRLDQIRILACAKCRELAGPSNSLVDLVSLQRAIGSIAPPDLTPPLNELSDVLDVEGDPQNGGGNFKITHDVNGNTMVLYEPDEHQLAGDSQRVGEIGSPSIQGAVPFRGQQQRSVASPAGF